MTVDELVSAVKDVLLQDDAVARQALADFLEERQDPEADNVRHPYWSAHILCPRCLKPVIGNENERKLREEYSSAEGDSACLDFTCGHCKTVTLTVVYRPACWHHYEAANLEGGFSKEQRMPVPVTPSAMQSKFGS